MVSIINSQSRSIEFAIAMVIGFFVAFRIALGMSRTDTELIDLQARGIDSGGDTPDSNTNNDYDHSGQNNAVYFTSMDAEFEWNRFMVPDYDLGMIDPNQSIERDRDSGRRLLKEDILRYGTLRGLRKND